MDVGMTELSCIVFVTNPPEVSILDNQTSVGAVVPHGAAKIVDGSLKTLPPGSKGELLVSGYLAFQGYYKNPEKTNETLVKDAKGRSWVRTGDTAIIDAAGNCEYTQFDAKAHPPMKPMAYVNGGLANLMMM